MNFLGKKWENQANQLLIQHIHVRLHLWLSLSQCNPLISSLCLLGTNNSKRITCSCRKCRISGTTPHLLNQSCFRECSKNSLVIFLWITTVFSQSGGFAFNTYLILVYKTSVSQWEMTSQCFFVSWKQMCTSPSSHTASLRKCWLPW